MLEKFILYKKIEDLTYYTYTLVLKYPKSERTSLVSDIKTTLNKIINIVIYFQKERTNLKRKYYLNELDTLLKVFNLYIRISYKMKYININNYKSFSNKLLNIYNVIEGLKNTYEIK